MPSLLWISLKNHQCKSSKMELEVVHRGASAQVKEEVQAQPEAGEMPMHSSRSPVHTTVFCSGLVRCRTLCVPDPTDGCSGGSSTCLYPSR